MAGIVLAAGCGQLVIPVPNCADLPTPNLTPLAETGTARLGIEDGLDEVLWLEISKEQGSGTVGG